jgi:hypothetical protein
MSPDAGWRDDLHQAGNRYVLSPGQAVDRCVGDE